MWMAAYNAREMALRSVEIRRQRRDQAVQRQAEIEHIIEVLDHEQLGPFALTAALALAHNALSGEMAPPETPLDRLRLAETAVLLHKIGRLEMGESTSNTVVAHVGPTALAEVLAIRDQARRAIEKQTGRPFDAPHDVDNEP